MTFSDPKKLTNANKSWLFLLCFTLAVSALSSPQTNTINLTASFFKLIAAFKSLSLSEDVCQVMISVSNIFRSP